MNTLRRSTQKRPQERYEQDDMELPKDIDGDYRRRYGRHIRKPGIAS